MECLHCGDCCLRMSPKTGQGIDGNNRECPDLIKVEDFYFCSEYSKRPHQCANHSFPSRFCTIGINKLGLKDMGEVQNRVIKGWKLIQGIGK